MKEINEYLYSKLKTVLPTYPKEYKGKPPFIVYNNISSRGFDVFSGELYENSFTYQIDIYSLDYSEALDKKQEVLNTLVSDTYIINYQGSTESKENDLFRIVLEYRIWK
jgi:hypothetical protein